MQRLVRFLAYMTFAGAVALATARHLEKMTLPASATDVASLASIAGLVISIVILYFSARIGYVRQSHDLIQRWDRDREGFETQLVSLVKQFELRPEPSAKHRYQVRENIQFLIIFGRFLTIPQIALLYIVDLLARTDRTPPLLLAWWLRRVLNVYYRGIYEEG